MKKVKSEIEKNFDAVIRARQMMNRFLCIDNTNNLPSKNPIYQPTSKKVKSEIEKNFDAVIRARQMMNRFLPLK